MKNLIIIFSFLFYCSGTLYAQNIGIGTTNPLQLLHIKDGNLYVENGEIRLDPYGSSIKRLGANVSYGAQANVHLAPGNNYSTIIYEGGIEYARFRGTTRRFGMGTTSPEEKIDINGAIKLGAAENSNAGTIQWTGTDMQAYNGTSWKSLITPSSIKDADGDTEIILTEAAQDDITMKVDNKEIMKTEIFADGSHYIDWFGNPNAGAFQKIQHRFYNNGIVTGIVGTTNDGSKSLRLTGDDKVTILGNYNDGIAVATYLQVGKFINNTYGVGLSKGGSVSGSLRALLDVRGDFECDGAEINDGLTVNDGATINDIMNLVPMAEPSSPVAGDVYMDDGSCNQCSSGKTSLRYYNGVHWVTL